MNKLYIQLQWSFFAHVNDILKKKIKTRKKINFGIDDKYMLDAAAAAPTKSVATTVGIN